MNPGKTFAFGIMGVAFSLGVVAVYLEFGLPAALGAASVALLTTAVLLYDQLK